MIDNMLQITKVGINYPKKSNPKWNETTNKWHTEEQRVTHTKIDHGKSNEMVVKKITWITVSISGSGMKLG